jgi:hypothetical protein
MGLDSIGEILGAKERFRLVEGRRLADNSGPRRPQHCIAEGVGTK